MSSTTSSIRYLVVTVFRLVCPLGLSSNLFVLAEQGKNDQMKESEKYERRGRGKDRREPKNNAKRDKRRVDCFESEVVKFGISED